jgi:hypothetical protein
MNFKPIHSAFAGFVCATISVICCSFLSISEAKTNIQAADLVVVDQKVDITRIDDTHAIYTFTIKNIGSKAANLTNMKITTQLSLGSAGMDANLQRVFRDVATDFYTNMRVTALPNPTTLEPNATVEVRHRLTVVNPFPSRIGIKVILDVTGAVKELNARNNEAVGLTKNNTMLDDEVDLHVTKDGNLTRMNDHTLNFSFGIYNDGNTSIDMKNVKISTELLYFTLTSRVQEPAILYLYKDMRYDSPINPLILEPGSGAIVKMKVGTTDILPNFFNLILKIDAENVVPELLEDNNLKILTMWESVD